MSLPFRVPEIPAALRESLPPGLDITLRGGQEFVLVRQLFCSRACGLITPAVKLHGEDAISLRVRAGGAQGMLFLAAHWGGHKKLFDFMFRQGETDQLLEAFCPRCSAPMTIESRCRWPGCHSNKKIELFLPRPGDRVLLCARWACPDHELISPGIPREALDHLSRINFFGEGEDALLDAP